MSILDNLTIKEIKEIKNMFCSDNSKKTNEYIDLGLRIVALQRGWVYIGILKQKDMNCLIENAYCIRRWGTSNGLGELALKGKQSNTVLDQCGTIEYHKLTEVFTMKCDPQKWGCLYE